MMVCGTESRPAWIVASSESGCPRCPDGSGCDDNEQCESFVCANGACAPPRCDDGVRNGDETDIDCGGAVCGRCGQERQCVQNSDCVSGQCFIWMPGPDNNDPQPNICLPPAQLGEACERGPEDVLCDEGLVCDDVGAPLCVLPHCVNNQKMPMRRTLTVVVLGALHVPPEWDAWSMATV